MSFLSLIAALALGYYRPLPGKDWLHSLFAPYADLLNRNFNGSQHAVAVLPFSSRDCALRGREGGEAALAGAYRIPRRIDRYAGVGCGAVPNGAPKSRCGIPCWSRCFVIPPRKNG